MDVEIFNEGKVFTMKRVIAFTCITVLFLSLFSGCAINKRQRLNDLKSQNYDYALIFKGNNLDVAKCFIDYEKKNAKTSLEIEKRIRSDFFKVPSSGGKVHVRWDALPIKRDGYVGTRVLCQELESMIVDYRYVVDFIQINPEEVLVEFYGHKYTAGWDKMGCGDVVVDIDALIAAVKAGDQAKTIDLMDRFSTQSGSSGLPDNVGRIAFKHAAENGYIEIMRTLLQRGINVDTSMVGDTTPLRAASENGHLDIVKLLLEFNADVNASNDDGRTALQAAAKNGNLEIATLLIAKGADVNAKTTRGYNALHDAIWNNHPEIARLLLAHGATATAVGRGGNTALHGAALHGYLDLVRIFVEKGSGINQSNSDGYTPLSYAVIGRHTEIMKYLIEKGADVNVTTKSYKFWGTTALMNATHNNNIEIVKLLLDHGARVNPKDSQGKTALDYAIGPGRENVRELLLAHGAKE